MNLSKSSRRIFLGGTLFIIIALLCISSYQSFAYNRLVPVKEFEMFLMDSCKILDMKVVSLAGGQLSSDDVPCLLKTLLNYKKDADGNIEKPYKKSLRYQAIEYTIKGDNVVLTCVVKIIDGYVYNIEIILDNNNKQAERSAVTLAEIIKLWKPMKKMCPIITRKQASEK
jgi:hypothetical protein